MLSLAVHLYLTPIAPLVYAVQFAYFSTLTRVTVSYFYRALNTLLDGPNVSPLTFQTTIYSVVSNRCRTRNYFFVYP